MSALAPHPLGWLDALLTWLAERDTPAAAPLWSGGPTASEYAEGLLRPSGSYVTEVTSPEALRRFFEALPPPAEITAEVPPAARLPDHRYWQSPVPPGYTAWEAIARLDTLSESQLAEVRVTRGKHGLELQAPSIPATPAQVITLITEGSRLVTWYPGFPTPPSPLEAATVKLARPG